MDTEAPENEKVVLRGQLKQAVGTKNCLTKQMDSLIIDDPYYDRKFTDLKTRYDEQYDIIEDIESHIDELQNQIDNALSLAVYSDDVLVGFVIIGNGTVGNENESDLINENYSLWRLMIDKKYQRKGLGKQTIDAAMDLIRTFPFGAAKKYGSHMNLNTPGQG